MSELTELDRKRRTMRLERIYLTYFVSNSDETVKNEKSENFTSQMLTHAPECSVFQAQKSNKITLSFRGEKSFRKHIMECGIRDEDIVYVGNVRPESEIKYINRYDLERVNGEFVKRYGKVLTLEG